MKSDELKALYEKYPFRWIAQYRDMGRWISNSNPSFLDLMDWRLKPKLPADLPEPTENMMNRAVYLGHSEIKGVKSTFEGWFYAGSKDQWKRGVLILGDIPGFHYCIDINDPNADEIIELNRAEDQTPNEVITAQDINQQMNHCFVQIEKIRSMAMELARITEQEKAEMLRWAAANVCKGNDSGYFVCTADDLLEEALWLETRGVHPDTGEMWLTSRMEKDIEEVQSSDLKEAKAAIEDLLTEQNGPPLIRRHRQWQAAVDRCRAVIAGESNEPETN